MGLDGFDRLVQGPEATAPTLAFGPRPVEPGVEPIFSLRPVATVLINIPQFQPNLIGLAGGQCFQIQLVEFLFLAFGQVLRILPDAYIQRVD